MDATVATSPESRVRETFRALRAAEFPWTAETIYLNNASTGPIPERTRRIIDDANARRTAPHLFTDREQQQVLREARTAAAGLINADPSEIALTTSTSHGLNLAVELPLEAGEIVLSSEGEFPSNVYPWMLMRERGVRLELAATTPEGWPNEECLLERLTDPRVRVLALSFIQFSRGYRIDLERLGAACRANGTYLVVDAIQALGQVPLNVRATPVDILACGGQKWLLSPWGTGFVYVRRELLDRLKPRLVGWGCFQGTDDYSRLTDYNPNLLDDARRFEGVTLPYQDIVGMTESLKLIREISVECIEEYNRGLRGPLLQQCEAGELRIVSPTDPAHDSSIICIAPRQVAEVYHALKKARVICSLREGAIRLSPHFFNIEEEVDKVAGILTGR